VAGRKYNSSLPVAIYILAASIVGLIATSLLRDTNRDISGQYENVWAVNGALGFHAPAISREQSRPVSRGPYDPAERRGRLAVESATSTFR